MANLARTAVVERANYEGLGLNSKRYAFFELTLTLASMGSATNKIQATTLNLSSIAGCTCAVLSTNAEVLPASPSADGSLLLLGGGASNAPADYTGDYNITVWGPPQNVIVP